MSDPANSIELLSIDAAHQEQPDVVVVHGVDWTIGPGEWWAIDGGPGSGKTSLFSTAAGLTAPIGGAVRIFGRPYWEVGESEQVELRRRIGFVFDGGGRLFAHMTVLQNLMLPIQYHTNCDAASARARAMELLERVGVAAHAELMPSRLSSALQKRVALARTLTDSIEILFLDSPIVGLGPEDARWWLDFFSDLLAGAKARGERMSIVSGGYDLGRWFGWADHFGVLCDGSFRQIDVSEARAHVGAEAGALVHPETPGED